MEIIFVRHAHKETEDHDTDISSKGYKQSKYLAKKFKGLKIDKFYCSGLKRTHQTSEAITKVIGLKPQIEECLNEFERDIIKAKKIDSVTRKRHKELINFLEKISKNPDKDETILIIAHGFTNRLIMAYFTKLKKVNLIPFRQFETAVNAVSWSSYFNNWRLDSWNDDCHLPKRLKQKRS